MKATLATVSFLVLASSSVAMGATPVAGPSAHFRVDRVTGALVEADGAALAVSPTGTIGGLRTISREDAGEVSLEDAKNGRILTRVGKSLDDDYLGTPVVRDSSGRVVLSRGMSGAVDRVLTAGCALSWDGAAVWQVMYSPRTPVVGEGAEQGAHGTWSFLSLRIADQRTFEQNVPRGMGADVAALSFDDILFCLSTGGVLRYQAGKLLWQLDAMPGGYWKISDIDIKRSIALITDEDGGVAGVDINHGTLLWRWHGPSSADAIKRFLAKTRSQKTSSENTARAVEDAKSLVAEGSLHPSLEEDQVLRMEYGVGTAAFTPDGKVLMTGNPLAPWVAIFNPATLALEGREVMDALALAGHASAAETFRSSGAGPGIDLLVLSSGSDGASNPTLLFKSPEGWYTTPLADLQ